VAFALLACSERDANLGRFSSPERTATERAATATLVPEATATPSGTAPTFDAARALEHVRVLSVEIGERLAGTAADDAALAYVAAQLESYGYDAAMQPFEFAPERFGTAAVLVPEGELAALRLEGSGTGAVTGEAVYVGLARQTDVDAVAVAGKVAIADRGAISFQSKYLALREAGAIGVIVINSEPGPLPYGNLDTRAIFPVVSVAGADGPALMVAAAAAAEITIDVPDDDVGHSANVLAAAPGTDRCQILVGGHHDTVPAAPGANDNASGVAHVLELARAMAEDGLDQGLCFATFGAEEHGLFGSARMAADMAEADSLPELMINLDVTAIGNSVEVIGSRRLRDLAIEFGDETGIEVLRSQLPANAGSDHQSFADEGVEVVFFTSGEFGAIHSPQDTFDAVEEDEIERIGKIVLLLLRNELERIAGD
jgi:aminopeptidase YwaD